MGAGNDGIVIVGGGQAGCQLAASLRTAGYEGRLRLVAEEPVLPYQRPPLSKAYLAGKAKADALPLRPAAFYEQNRIDLHLAEPALAIDRRARRLRLAKGELAFSGLALTTGGRVRKLRGAEAESDSILYLRTLEDADRLKTRLENLQKLIVIGGGFIGLEVAASARILGKDVTVIEALPRLMARVLPPVLSDHFAALHRSHGVRLLLGARIEAVGTMNGRSVELRMGDGRRLEADLALVGIGIEPCSELALESGLACDNGILVDACARTSDPAIVAAGDCANHPNPFADNTRLRLESVQNAIDQAKTAALSLLGRDEPYASVPWFWSDQYDVKLQMVGLSHGHDRFVLRGNPGSGRFSVFYFKADRLIAIDTVNRPADHMLGRRLIAAGAGPTPEQAADEGFDLKTLHKQPA